MVETAHGPALGWIDWLARLLLWAVIVFGFARQLADQLSGSEILLPLLLFAALMAATLLASIAPVAGRVYDLAQTEPVAAAILPLVLLLPFYYYGRATDTFELSDLLVAAVLLFMPMALVLVRTPRLRASDIWLGLATVAMPLVQPLIHNQEIESTGLLLRAGAFALPILLLVFTSRRQKERLDFLFLCAVLAVWYSIEFNAFPAFTLPGQSADMPYFHLAAIPYFLYLLAAAGKFNRLGLSFKPSPRGLSIFTSNLAVFALIAVPLGLLAKFITPGFSASTPLEALARALTIYAFVALPEEILFRGTLLTYLDETMRWPEAITIGISALVFGAAHLNNQPNPGWYFVLAVIAGVFYARTYLATRNVGTAATLHTAVDWLWAFIFAG